MDWITFFELWTVGSIVFIGICAYKYRNMNYGNHVRKIPKPTWPRIKLEEIFGV